MLSQVGPGDHICVPFRETEGVDSLVAAFLVQGFARGERCLLASTPEHSQKVLHNLQANGVAVNEQRSRGALLVADVEAFYRPTGRHDPEASLALVSDVARQARADGFTALRGAGGPLAWGNLPDDEQRAVGSYEGKVNEVLRKEGVTALCLYDERSAGSGPLKRMLRTHPRAIVGGRMCTNPFCGDLEDRDDPQEVQSMLRALRGREDFEGGIGRLAGELARLREREVARAEEIDSRNGLLQAISRQLGPQVGALEKALHQASESSSVSPLPADWRDCFDQFRESTAQLRRLAHRLEEASVCAEGTPAPMPQEGELAALAATTMETWRRHRQIEGTDVRLQASTPVTGRWDLRRMGGVVQTVLETAWERSWGSPVDMYVEDLGLKARLTAVYEDMEVLAGAPFDAPSGTGADLVAHARDSLRVSLWAARENVRSMGGAMGLSVWPDGRVSITIDLPR